MAFALIKETKEATDSIVIVSFEFLKSNGHRSWILPGGPQPWISGLNTICKWPVLWIAPTLDPVRHRHQRLIRELETFRPLLP